MKMARKVFYLIILFSLGLNSFAQRTHLRFNPEPGSEYITDLKMRTEINQEIMGIDQSVQMIIIMV